MTPPATAAASTTRPRRRAEASARPLTVAPRPRRVSGPARTRPQAKPSRPSRTRRAPAPGLIALLPRLLDLRAVDRLVRGRFSIGLVAFALIGIVTMQLGLLKLNAGIGRTLDRESVLQRENSLLGIENSELAAGTRIQSRAAELGMETVPAGELRFLGAHPGDAARAVAALGSPARAAAAAAREAEIASANASAQSAGEATSGEAANPAAGEAAQGTGSDTAAAGGESATANSAAGTAATGTGAAVGASAPGAGEATASGPGGGTQAAPAG